MILNATLGVIIIGSDGWHWLSWECPTCNSKRNPYIDVESSNAPWRNQKCIQCEKTIKVLNPTTAPTTGMKPIKLGLSPNTMFVKETETGMKIGVGYETTTIHKGGKYVVITTDEARQLLKLLQEALGE